VTDNPLLAGFRREGIKVLMLGSIAVVLGVGLLIFGVGSPWAAIGILVGGALFLALAFRGLRMLRDEPEEVLIAKFEDRLDDE
jgi:Flp pilus assembly protein TadB